MATKPISYYGIRDGGDGISLLVDHVPEHFVGSRYAWEAKRKFFLESYGSARDAGNAAMIARDAELATLPSISPKRVASSMSIFDKWSFNATDLFETQYLGDDVVVYRPPASATMFGTQLNRLSNANGRLIINHTPLWLTPRMEGWGIRDAKNNRVRYILQTREGDKTRFTFITAQGTLHERHPGDDHYSQKIEHYYGCFNSRGEHLTNVPPKKWLSKTLIDQSIDKPQLKAARKLAKLLLALPDTVTVSFLAHNSCTSEYGMMATAVRADETGFTVLWFEVLRANVFKCSAATPFDHGTRLRLSPCPDAQTGSIGDEESAYWCRHNRGMDIRLPDGSHAWNQYRGRPTETSMKRIAVYALRRASHPAPTAVPLSLSGYSTPSRLAPKYAWSPARSLVPAGGWLANPQDAVSYASMVLLTDSLAMA
jgi:hypothetical protein